jgi:hypothetical protein
MSIAAYDSKAAPSRHAVVLLKVGDVPLPQCLSATTAWIKRQQHLMTAPDSTAADVGVYKSADHSRRIGALPYERHGLN